MRNEGSTAIASGVARNDKTAGQGQSAPVFFFHTEKVRDNT